MAIRRSTEKPRTSRGSRRAAEYSSQLRVTQNQNQLPTKQLMESKIRSRCR